MLFRKLDDIRFADKRFAARHHEVMNPKRLCLSDKTVHILKAEVEGLPIFSRPAAGAVQIARTRRIEDYNPRDIAAILLGIFLGIAETAETAFIAGIKHQSL